MINKMKEQVREFLHYTFSKSSKEVIEMAWTAMMHNLRSQFASVVDNVSTGIDSCCVR